MALPAIADVRRGQPAASIVVAARPSVAPLFTLVGDVDEVVTAPEKRTAAAGRLRRRPASAELVSFRVDGGARRSPRTVGLPDRLARAWLLTRAVPRAPAGLHQVSTYQQLVRSLGFPNGPARAAHRRDARASATRAPASSREPAGTGACRSSRSRPARRTDPRSGGRRPRSPIWPPDLQTTGLAPSCWEPQPTRTPRPTCCGRSPGRATVFDLVGKTDLPDAGRRPRELPRPRRQRFRRAAPGRRAGRERHRRVWAHRRADECSARPRVPRAPSPEATSHEPRAT